MNSNSRDKLVDALAEIAESLRDIEYDGVLDATQRRLTVDAIRKCSEALQSDETIP